MKPRPLEYKDFASYCTVTYVYITPYQGHTLCRRIFTNVSITPQFPEQSS